MAIMPSLTMPIGSSVNTRRCFSRSVQSPTQQPNRRKILLLPSLNHRKLPQISNNTILRCSKNPSYEGGVGGGGNSGGGSGWWGSSGDDDDGRWKSPGITSMVFPMFKELFLCEDGKTLRMPFTGKYWPLDALVLFFDCWLFDMKTHLFRDFLNEPLYGQLIAEAKLSKDDDLWSELSKWRQTKRTT